MKPMQVGLLGLGTVGSGTVEVLRRNREEIARRAGRDIVVKAASARDLRKARSVSMDGIELVADPAAIIARPGDLDHDVAPCPARDLLAVAPQHLDGAAADRAQAQQADVDGFHRVARA